MGLLTIGINYKSAAVAVREKLAIGEERASAIIQEVISKQLASEVILVSTCNRTELYFYTDSVEQVLAWFKQNLITDAEVWKKCCYTLFATEVVKHIMRVASGLDSMVIGETEILGQLKVAYQRAQVIGGVGRWLDRLFQRAFAAAKLVRTKTKIGTNSLSVAYISVRLAELIFTDICAMRVLVVGAGDNARLIIKHLLSVGLKEIWLVNRSEQRARELAYEIDPKFAWRFLQLDKLASQLEMADIVLTSTASEEPIITKEMVAKAIEERKHNPMLIVDVAVPRDVEAAVGELADVNLYCMDDLQTMAEENRCLRQNEISDAEGIIEVKTREFMHWLESQNWVGAIKGIRLSMEDIREECLQQSLKLLQNGKGAEEALQYLAYNLTNKFSHLPTVKVKQAGLTGDDELLRKLKLMFNTKEKVES